MIIKLFTIDGVNWAAAKDVKIRMHTAMEQSLPELTELQTMFQQRVLVAFKPEETPFLDTELKELDSVDMDLEDTTKTPSKRLRAVFYRLWEQNHKMDTDFKSFYKIRMEKLIEQVKNRLE